MNTRKLFLILSAVLSGISALIPFYFVMCDGISNGVEVSGESAISLIKTFSGIAILITAAAIIVSVLFIKQKLGYIIASLLNVACSVWGLLFMLNTPVDMNTPLETLQKLDPSFSSMEALGITEASTGPGMYFVIAAMICVLVTMLLLFVYKEED